MNSQRRQGWSRISGVIAVIGVVRVIGVIGVIGVNGVIGATFYSGFIIHPLVAPAARPSLRTLLEENYHIDRGISKCSEFSALRMASPES